MFKFSRAYERTREFLGRQGGFDFAIVTDAVLEITMEIQKAARSWFRKWRNGFRTFDPIKRPHQLVLELDAIAQMPLFQHPIR